MNDLLQEIKAALPADTATLSLPELLRAIARVHDVLAPREEELEDNPAFVEPTFADAIARLEEALMASTIAGYMTDHYRGIVARMAGAGSMEELVGEYNNGLAFAATVFEMIGSPVFEVMTTGIATKDDFDNWYTYITRYIRHHAGAEQPEEEKET
jgi:hypothetical protein